MILSKIFIFSIIAVCIFAHPHPNLKRDSINQHDSNLPVPEKPFDDTTPASNGVSSEQVDEPENEEPLDNNLKKPEKPQEPAPEDPENGENEEAEEVEASPDGIQSNGPGASVETVDEVEAVDEIKSKGTSQSHELTTTDSIFSNEENPEEPEALESGEGSPEIPEIYPGDSRRALLRDVGIPQTQNNSTNISTPVLTSKPPRPKPFRPRPSNRPQNAQNGPSGIPASHENLIRPAPAPEGNNQPSGCSIHPQGHGHNGNQWHGQPQPNNYGTNDVAWGGSDPSWNNPGFVPSYFQPNNPHIWQNPQPYWNQGGQIPQNGQAWGWNAVDNDKISYGHGHGLNHGV